MENMELTKLTAISPIDGRYRDKCEVLADYFSEYALGSLDYLGSSYSDY